MDRDFTIVLMQKILPYGEEFFSLILKKNKMLKTT